MTHVDHRTPPCLVNSATRFDLGEDTSIDFEAPRNPLTLEDLRVVLGDSSLHPDDVAASSLSAVEKRYGMAGLPGQLRVTTDRKYHGTQTASSCGPREVRCSPVRWSTLSPRRRSRWASCFMDGRSSRRSSQATGNLERNPHASGSLPLRSTLENCILRD